jgi:drug/metabolite transporter (DMT)-like permease
VSGIRQFLAAVILFPVLLFTQNLKWIGWRNFKIQIILSSLMLIGANGLTTAAETHLTSSLTSLISSLSPVFIFILSLTIGLEKFNRRSLTGLLLGFLGVVFIFWDGIKDLANPDYLYGMAILFTGIASWSVGTVYTKKMQIKTDNLFLNLFYQFAFAGVVQIIFGLIFTEDYRFEEWSYRSMFAIVYLAIFGSVITFYAYHYLLKNLLATQVSMLSYVNTIIGISLSWLILGEKISAKFIIATILIISGVFIINYKPGLLRKKKSEL